MSLSTKDHEYAQQLVDSCNTEEQKSELLSQARYCISTTRHKLKNSFMSASDYHNAHLSVEIILRFECKEKNKGWLHRFFRRVPLTHELLIK